MYKNDNQLIKIQGKSNFGLNSCKCLRLGTPMLTHAETSRSLCGSEVSDVGINCLIFVILTSLGQQRNKKIS